MNTPLSEIFRPKEMKEIVGQEHLFVEQGIIKASILNGKPTSLILWGPPGCGKTTLALLYAKAFQATSYTFSAVMGTTAEIKKILQKIDNEPLFTKYLMIFIDEIHRFNKAQQDLFLPYVEKGFLILIGATTENPSFHLNNALLSRVRVLTLNPLEPIALDQLLTKYLERRGNIKLSQVARTYLIQSSQGDARQLFNLLEALEQAHPQEEIEIPLLEKLLNKKISYYDKHGDHHYNLISALHKAVRGSDPDASLYWFCRMLEGGEDPLYLARRLIRMATEDVGLADPNALVQAIAAKDAYEMLGSPEGELALAQVVIYLALAPKSNALYTAYGAAKKDAANTSHLSPPSIILNAPTKLMKELGYGKHYQYDHDTERGFSGQNYFPDNFERSIYYQPLERGFEREMKKRLEYFEKLRKRGNNYT